MQNITSELNRKGVRNMSIKKIAFGAAATALAFGSLAIPAFASNLGDGSGYGTQPGFTVAQSQTQCSGAGAFDAFGQNYNFGNTTSGHIVGAPGNAQNGNGADGTLTGSNNSNLCGNPQN